MRETTAGRRRPAGRQPGAPGRTTGREPVRKPANTRSAPARERRHRTAARTPEAPRTLTFTHRAAVLGLTLCAVVLMLAYPAKEYLGQRSAIAAAAARQRSLTAQLAALTRAHAAADDPEQVVAQARARLHYTLPGTRNYLVVTPPAAAPVTTKAGNATVLPDPDGSWFGRLYDSDRRAGS